MVLDRDAAWSGKGTGPDLESRDLRPWHLQAVWPWAHCRASAHRFPLGPVSSPVKEVNWSSTIANVPCSSVRGTRSVPQTLHVCGLAVFTYIALTHHFDLESLNRGGN